MAPWWMLAGIVLLAAAIGLVATAVIAGRKGHDDAAVIRLTQVVALVTAVVAGLGAVVTALTALLQPAVAISVPVQEFWPALPAGTETFGTSATRAQGGFTSAELVASGLSVGARVCWAIAQALAWLVPGAIAALVAVACSQVRSGQPFAPMLARLTMVVAAVVSIGGTGSQVLGDVAGSIAAHEVLGVTGWSSTSGNVDALLPQPALLVTFPFWPIGAGLALAALAIILRLGQALQRDAEGLV